MQEKTVSQAIAHRRSVRVYDPKKNIDTKKVKFCIEQATLVANSENLQLWEFYHITSQQMKKQVAINCYNQPAARTAHELVIPVVRLDLWRERIKSNIDFIRSNVKTIEDEKKIKGVLTYYQKIIPQLYRATFYLYGLLNKVKVSFQGFQKVTYREVTAADLRVVGHKSTALAAQSFMMSMAAQGYDTCPMEGFDSLRLKKILGLPKKAQISMVIGCGIRKPEGVYGKRFRIPFKEIYREL